MKESFSLTTVPLVLSRFYTLTTPSLSAKEGALLAQYDAVFAHESALLSRYGAPVANEDTLFAAGRGAVSASKFAVMNENGACSCLCWRGGAQSWAERALFTKLKP